MALLDKRVRRRYKEGYDPLYWHDRSERLIEDTSEIERNVWGRHPCTQALLMALQGDIAGTVQTWIAGGYAESDSTDATAQMQAKARGIAQACDDVMDTIATIGMLQGDTDGDKTSGTQDSSET